MQSTWDMHPFGYIFFYVLGLTFCINQEEQGIWRNEGSSKHERNIKIVGLTYRNMKSHLTTVC